MRVLGIDVQKPIWMLTRSEADARRSGSLASLGGSIDAHAALVEQTRAALERGDVSQARALQNEAARALDRVGASVSSTEQMLRRTSPVRGHGLFRLRPFRFR